MTALQSPHRAKREADDTGLADAIQTAIDRLVEAQAETRRAAADLERVLREAHDATS